MKRINIEDINFDLDYEGYLWYSNAQKPEQRTSIFKDDFKNIPFIVEGNLYSKENKISISINYRDGEYFIYLVNLKDLPKDQNTVEEYIAHDLDGVKNIKILQYWEEEADSLLEGMVSLVPTWRVFIGFVKTKNIKA